MYFEQELTAPPEFDECRKLCVKALALFKTAEIFFQISEPPRDAADSSEVSTAWLENFIIEPDTPAFFMKINSPEDVRSFNKDFIALVKRTMENLKKYIENNSGVLSEDMQDKILSFSKPFGTVLRIYTTKQKSFEKAVEECNSVQEIREEIRQICADRLKNIFQNVLDPLYEGMRLTPNAAYEFVLSETNAFLKNLGISTLTIEVGEKISDNLPYEWSRAENTTDDPAKKDTVVEIQNYAYVFSEERGAENFCIYEGRAVVLVYSGR